ncbi:unnamed protein product [Rhodiola kirilowii]
MRDGRDPSGAEMRGRSKRAYPSRPNRSENNVKNMPSHKMQLLLKRYPLMKS